MGFVPHDVYFSSCFYVIYSYAGNIEKRLEKCNSLPISFFLTQCTHIGNQPYKYSKRMKEIVDVDIVNTIDLVLWHMVLILATLVPVININ